MADALNALLDSTQPERLATGFVFTEGPLWHPEGFYYFVDMRQSVLHPAHPRQGRGARPRAHRRGQWHDVRPRRAAWSSARAATAA